MYRFRFVHILVGLASCLCTAWAQVSPAPSIYFHTFGKTDGLSSGKVRNVMQDKTGFVYLCTSAGINRFDGYSLTPFQFSGASPLAALTEVETRASLQDKEGNFWVATDFNGLFKYNPRSAEIRRFLHKEGSTLYLRDLIADRAGQYLWCAGSNGIVRIGLQGQAPCFFFEGEQCLTVFEDKEGTIWTGTIGNGIRSLDPGTGKTTAWLPDKNKNPSLFPGVYCRAITQDINGDMLFGTAVGLFRLDKQSGKTKGYFHVAGNPYSCPQNGITTLLLDHRQQLWLGTYGSGLALFERETERFFNYQRKAGTIGSLAGNYIETLFEDNFGQIWVGDHSAGLSYFNGNVGFIRNIEQAPSAAHALPLRQISCLLAQGEILWIGLPGGIASYRPENGAIEFFPLRYTPFAAWEEVSALLSLPSGDLLVGTWSGLLIFSPASGRYSSFLPQSLNPGSKILSMLAEGDSVIWLSTSDQKLWRLNTEAGTLRRFEQENNIPGRAECNAMFMSSLAKPCFGSYNGFYEYDAALDAFIQNNTPAYWAEKGNAVAGIAQDKTGTCWITRHGGGLDAFNLTNRQYRHFGLEEGLPDMFCRAVQTDSFHRVWVGTDLGLMVFTPPRNLFDSPVKCFFKTLQLQDGLAFNKAGCSATLRVQGRQWLYFGSEDGLIELCPDKLEYNTAAPNPALTAIYLFNQLLRPSREGIQQQPAEYIKELTLPPLKNFFSFEFSALNLLAPEKNSYSYLLEGYDRGWVHAGTRHLATYTNVPPGDYVFKVQAYNSDGVPSQTPMALKLRIRPAWYQSAWFFGLLAAGFIAGVWGWFRWRLIQLQKLERMRQAIAADLHDEVGASLTSIQILAQLAAHQDPGRRREALEKLPAQISHTVAALREIVWNIQPGNDDLNILAGQLMRYAGEFLEKAAIRYTLEADEFPPTLKLNPVARQHLARIFKEALNNLVKHSKTDFASVALTCGKKSLLLRIRDNGLGFDPATQAQGNGLANMQKRAELAGGTLVFNSSPGEGAELTLLLPLHASRKWGLL